VGQRGLPPREGWTHRRTCERGSERERRKKGRELGSPWRGELFDLREPLPTDKAKEPEKKRVLAAHEEGLLVIAEEVAARRFGRIHLRRARGGKKKETILSTDRKSLSSYERT